MAKEKILYNCTECGASFPKWAGQCGDCGAWNTLIEMLQPRVSTHPRFSGYAGEAGEAGDVERLGEISFEQEERTGTGINELDRVLGGGLVTGSVTLVGGDPGMMFFFCLFYPSAIVSHDHLGGFVAHLLRDK